MITDLAIIPTDVVLIGLIRQADAGGATSWYRVGAD